jgi:hypothetical protein
LHSSPTVSFTIGTQIVSSVSNGSQELSLYKLFRFIRGVIRLIHDHDQTQINNDTLIGAYNMTIPLDGFIRIYGHDTTTLLRDVVTIDGLQTMSSISISPHACSHTDTPGLLPIILGDEWEKKVRLVDNDFDKKVIDEKHFSVSTSFPCVIVDVSNYSQVLKDAADKEGIEFPLNLRNYCWSKVKLEEILDKLRISVEQVEWLKEFKEYFIIFFTGWGQFTPKIGDLHDSWWIPWHPYLDYLASDYILSSKDGGPNAKGIGCDVHGFDVPIRHLYGKDPKKFLPEVKLAVNYLEESMQTVIGAKAKVKFTNELIYFPLHILALSKVGEDKKLLVERLRIPTEIFLNPNVKCYKGKPYEMEYLKGRVVFLPLNFNRAKDVTLLFAFFVAEE